MQMTLLDLTQNILSSLDSDEVNSIGDTVESRQVAQIIKNKYYDIVNRVQLPEHEQLMQLDASLDSQSPVLMYIPDGVAEVMWLKYFDSNTINEASNGGHDINVDIVSTSAGASVPPPGYTYVTVLPVEQFIDMTTKFNPENIDVESFVYEDTFNGKTRRFTFYYKNDKQPQYCTILSNYAVIFDGYDSTQDTTLQGSKTMAWCRVIPTFRMEDSFIPNLDDAQFTLLLNEAKALAYFEMKQSIHPKAEQEIKRGWSTVQKDKSVSNKPTYFEQLPSFGRRGVYGRSTATRRFKDWGWDRF